MTEDNEQFIKRFKTLIELNHEHCPDCKQMIPLKSESCIHCGKEIEK